MKFEDTVMGGEVWRKIQQESGEDILGMVMDYQSGRKTAGELMDKISEHCQLSFKAGIEERDREWSEWKDKYLPELIRDSRKEVVDVVMKRYGLIFSDGDVDFWQSKLKEWGL